jgi:hypothetical protein
MVNLVTTFPFYDRDDDATHNRWWCANDPTLFVQASMPDRVPPFAILLSGSGTPVIYIHNLTDDDWADITGIITTQTYVLSGGTYLVYNWIDLNLVTSLNISITKGGATAHTATWNSYTGGCDVLQIVIDRGTSTFYSEKFYCKTGLTAFDPTPTDRDGFILMQITDTRTIETEGGNIPYESFTSGFSQVIYLPCEAGRPTYEIEVEGNEDGKKVLYPTFRKVEKIQRIALLLPEYVCDALANAGIHETVSVFDQYGNNTAVHGLTIDTEWQRGDCQALAEVTFRKGYSYKRNC